MEKGPLFTIFTPTYNRAHLLPRLFESLSRQTCDDFEWIVVDDGSTDETPSLIAKWGGSSPFSTRYFRQENSGKHVAINRGTSMAVGEFLLILDSDDWLPPDTLERMLHHWQEIPGEIREGFSGIAGLCADPAGQVQGVCFPMDIIDADAIEIRTRYGSRDEHFGMIRTDIIRRFPFPEDLGRFVTESLVWNRIAREYQERFVNEIFIHKEYQAGGLSDRSVQTRVQSPRAARLYYQEWVELGRKLPIAQLLRGYANYARFALHARTPLPEQAQSISSPLLWGLTLPLGWAAYRRDRLILNRSGCVQGNI